MNLVRPLAEHLPSYRAALLRHWSADTVRGVEAAQEELQKIEHDPGLFLAHMVDREAAGGPVKLPDGSFVPRIPGYKYWMWDGEFCGSIGFRWQPGTVQLPAHVLGHIGYSVVPWKRRLGYATEALRQLLPIVRRENIPYVELTTDPGNTVSQKVIMKNGGVLIDSFTRPAAMGGQQMLRYRIEL